MSPAPSDPNAQRHLFLDPEALLRTSGADLRVNPPHTQQLVIQRDKPWEEAMINLFMTVLDEDGLLRLWYSCEDSQGGTNLAYAQSHDGIHWEKPELGIVDYHGSKANNLVGVPSHEGSVFVDAAAPPEERYVYITNIAREGVYRFYSPDGLHWQRDAEPLLQFRCDTQNVAMRHPERDEYVLYLRGWDTTPGWNDRLRRVARLTLSAIDRPAGVTPSGKGDNPTRDDDLPRIVDEAPAVFAADELDLFPTDVYNMSAQRYPLDPQWYLGFPAMFHHAPGGCAVNDGRLEIHCVGSHDGITWHRYDRNPYVRPGLRGGDSSHMVYMGTGMAVRGEEIWQYGSAFQTTHGQPKQRRQQGDGVIYRYVQRVDGFVSLRFGCQTGEALTTPVPVDGRHLVVNVDAGALGQLRLELRDSTGTVLPGFAFEDCDPISTNATRTPVTWAGSADLSKLLGQSVQLAIQASRTDLYSFVFSNEI